MLDRARSERATTDIHASPLLRSSSSLLECVRSSNTPRRAARQSRHAAFTVGTLLFALSHSLTPQCTSTRRQSLSRSLARFPLPFRPRDSGSLALCICPGMANQAAAHDDGGGGRPSLPLSRAGPPPLNPPFLFICPRCPPALQVIRPSD